MNLRCIYCQTPFTLNRVEMLGAIVTMNERHQSHYDAHCPRCRRANSISRQRMELFYPNWKEEAAKQKSAEPPKVESPASAFLKTEPLPKVKVATAKKPAAAKPAAKKPAAKKPAEKKPAAKATKTTSTKKK